MTEHVLVVGNPGTGKSTLLNSVIGKVVFRSGVSIATGLTSHVQWYEHEGVMYGDTPGLADVTHRNQAAREISKALRAGGKFKIMFVCTLESGRVQAADLTTIRLVLDAIEDSTLPFGIVVNKVTPRVYNAICCNPQEAETFLASINYGHRPTTDIFLYPHDERLVDADNMLIEPYDNFQNFVTLLQSRTIAPGSVADVAPDNFDAFQGTHAEDLVDIHGRPEMRQVALKNQMSWLTTLLTAVFGIVNDVAVKALSANSPALATALTAVINKFIAGAVSQPQRRA